MIIAGCKNAYQQGYSDAVRDFRKKSKPDVLDKIRSEIETEKNAGCHTQYAGGLDFALSIIDKYKEESEAGK